LADGASGRTTFLDSFRALTIVMVVAIHARAKVDLAPSIESVVSLIVTTIAVPSFFLCDGYLLVRRGRARATAGYREYLVKSARRLLVPWLVFSVLYTIVRGVFEWGGALDQRVVVGRSVGEVAVEVYSSGIAPQMYFLLSLFLIRTGVFAFRHLAVGPILLPWACFLIYTVLYREVLSDPLRQAFSMGLDPILHAAWGLQYYLLGIVLARTRVMSARSAALVSGTVWLILALALTAGLRQGQPALVQYAYLLGAFYGFVALGDRADPMARVGRNSMGIYLLHAPVLLQALAIPLAWIIHEQLALYIVLSIAAAGFSYLGATWLKRHPAGRRALGMPAA